jgi:hypothetical protein
MAGVNLLAIGLFASLLALLVLACAVLVLNHSWPDTAQFALQKVQTYLPHIYHTHTSTLIYHTYTITHTLTHIL